MNIKEYYTTDVHDYQIPPKFLEHSRDSNKPISVIGNGGSLSELTTEEINILNKTRLFRCNWAFNDPSEIKKQYAIYFAQAFDGSGESNFTQACKDASSSSKFTWYKFQRHVIYDFNIYNSVLDPDGNAVWPTTGIQMLLTAAFLIPSPAIHIAGLDMYTYKRNKRDLTNQEVLDYLKKHGKTFSKSPINSAGTGLMKTNLTYVKPETFAARINERKSTWHYIEIDILILLKIFSHCILSNRPVHIYHCDILKDIYKVAKNNLECIKEYYSLDRLSYDKPEALPKVYNMWRLINKTMDQVLPD